MTPRPEPNAFSRAGEEDSVTPIRMCYRQWAVVIEIARHPLTAARLHAAEHATDDQDPNVRQQAIRDAGEIVCAAHQEVRWLAGAGAAILTIY